MLVIVPQSTIVEAEGRKPFILEIYLEFFTNCTSYLTPTPKRFIEL